MPRSYADPAKTCRSSDGLFIGLVFGGSRRWYVALKDESGWTVVDGVLPNAWPPPNPSVSCYGKQVTLTQARSTQGGPLVIDQMLCSRNGCRVQTARLRSDLPYSQEPRFTAGLAGDKTVVVFPGHEQEIRMRIAPFSQLARAHDQILTNPGIGDVRFEPELPEIYSRSDHAFVLMQWRAELYALRVDSDGRFFPVNIRSRERTARAAAADL